MSDNTPEEKPATTPTLTPQERLDAARKAREAADAEYRAALYAVPLPSVPRDFEFLNNGGGSDDDDDGDDASEAMFETATELAAEPWGNDELRLRAIVFLTRSAIKVRENHVAQMDREQARDEARERAEAKGRR